MKLVVGLGNPGRKYSGTRHNIGFEVVSRIARAAGADAAREKFQGRLVEATLEIVQEPRGLEKLVLLCPQTYMNCSGRSVRPAVDFYKLSLDELLVVCDDFQLPLGKLRIRRKGSAGGQKGLQNIIDELGANHFPRLRIGIGTPPPRWQTTDYVLSRFHPHELDEIDQAADRAVEAVFNWVQHGIDECMKEYNA